VRPGISIQVLLRLAAQETVSSNSALIETDHLFLGILKLVEFNERSFAIDHNHDDTISSLMEELEALHKKLEEYGIDFPNGSRLICRELRQRICKSGSAHNGRRTLHRSAAARESCQKAERVAQDHRSVFWHAAHLFDAIIEKPSPELKRVLTRAGVAGLGSSIMTPLLDRYGRNMARNAAESSIGLSQEDLLDVATDPVCKVLIEAILKSNQLNALLVHTGRRTAMSAVENIADYMLTEAAPVPIRRQKIVEININAYAWRTRSVPAADLQARLHAILAEAVQAGNVIIFLNQFEQCLRRTDINFAPVLKKGLGGQKLRLIGCTDEAGYHQIISGDREWKQLLRPLWVHDPNEIVRL